MDEASGSAEPGQPTRGGERIVALDYIRGISVLGILFANIVAFGHPMLAYVWPGALPGGGTQSDGWIWLFQFVAVDGKFRGLFSLLFGAGLYLFYERLLAGGGTIVLQLRRLIWLLVFGLAHFALLFVGDILFLYAISGFAALLMLHWSARIQLFGGLAWYFVGALAFNSMYVDAAITEASQETGMEAVSEREQLAQYWERQISRADAQASVMSHGTYGDVVSYRLEEQTGQLIFAFVVMLVEIIPLMLIGMGLYRLGLFDGRLNRARLLRWGWAGLAGGALVSLGMGALLLANSFPPHLTMFMFNGPAAFPRLAMILGLAALLSISATKAAQGWLGERLVAAGRMAFSNYILTSVVMMLVFHGWAGGHFGQMSRAELLLNVLLGWAIMLGWSRPWLERFRYGPLEWLWRCLTYGRLFSLRRRL